MSENGDFTANSTLPPPPPPPPPPRALRRFVSVLNHGVNDGRNEPGFPRICGRQP